MNVLLISVQRNLDILGLKLLHHLLLAKGYHSHLLYLPSFDSEHEAALERLDSFLEDLAPKLIGVSVMAIDFPDAAAVTTHIKRRFPGVPVVWGGIHPTTAPEMCLEHADYVCVGEGEQALLDIASAVDQGRALDGINNVAFLRGGTFVQNPLYPLVQDLDSLPVVTQVPPQSFAQVGVGVTPLDRRLLRRHKRWSGGVYKTLTSRGCPYSCTYCCNNFLRKLYGNWTVRRRGVEHVMVELERAMREGPPLEYVDFSDDCFIACDMDYLRAFCREYKARIGKPFIVKGTPRYFTREKLDLLVDAGLAWANVGLQSGSERVCRDVYGRGVTPAEFLEVTQLIHEYPVAAYYDVIVDNPFETFDDTVETLNVLMAIPKPYYCLVFSLSFYEGTDLHQRLAESHPQEVGASMTKDYRFHDRTPANDFVEMAAMLPASWMRRLIAAYRQDPAGWTTRLAMGAAKLGCKAFLQPITYLRLIRRTQRGSLWRTLKVLPIYLNGGLAYYLNAAFTWKAPSRRTSRGT